MPETYDLYALRYARRDAKRRDHFIREVADPEAPMPMDYFVWVATNSSRTVLIDTGFKRGPGERRGRTFLRTPSEALPLVGVDPASISDVVVTHMHYDHAGTVDAFPNARVHLQEQELDFVTSRKHEGMRGSFEVDDVTEMVRRLYAGTLVLYDGSAGPWPGINIHLLGGHTAGTQVVQVRTERGWVVLAADASHYYENMESGISFSTMYDIEQNVRGFTTLRALADSTQHVVPGHDPEVLRRYPAPSAELDGTVARLDVAPRE